MRDFFGKRQLKALIASAGRAVDGHRLGRCVDRLRSGAPIDLELLRTARRAWGNEAWSADLRYLEEGTTRASRSTAPILECGTGLTTLLACAVAERTGVPVHCLEQDESWVEVVRGALARYGLSAHVSYAPLVPRTISSGTTFAASSCRSGRARALRRPGRPRALGPRDPGGLASGGLAGIEQLGITVDEVLLDDADEPRAARLLERWRRDFGCEQEVTGPAEAGMAVMRPRH